MNSARTCGKCRADGWVNHMVGCDMCDIWLHRDCADLTSETLDPNKSWRCDRCLHDEATEVASNRTHRTTRTSSSIRAQRAELALKLLEEEQELIKRNREKEDEFRRKEQEIQKKRAEEDAKLLKQKHELLQSLEEENGSVRSVMSSKASRKKVESWLGTAPGSAEKPHASGDADHSRIPMVTTGAATISNQKTSFDALFNTNATKDVNRPKSTSTPQKHLSTPSVIPYATVPLSNLPIQGTTSSSVSKWAGYYPGANVNTSSALPTIFESQSNTTNVTQTNVSFGSPGVTPSAPFASKLSDRQLPPIYTAGSHKPSSESMSFGQIVSVNSGSQFGRVSNVVTTHSLSKSGMSCSGQWNRPWMTPAVTTTPVSVPSLGVYEQPEAGWRMTTSSNSVFPATTGNSDSQRIDGSHCIVPPSGQQLDTSFQQAPSGVQIAARQVMPKELPSFSGDPQDWPLFSSSFYNSSTACGFTDAENLARLQRCLKGHALESVKSRLLMPQSVPHVMETLRMLYGRPEILIHSLLQKLRSIPSPKNENLQSIITYGLAVRNLVDHMHIANLEDHLRNPMLVHELVEKLPPQMRMQWSWYKRSISDVNLATFGEFMSEMAQTTRNRRKVHILIRLFILITSNSQNTVDKLGKLMSFLA